MLAPEETPAGSEYLEAFSAFSLAAPRAPTPRCSWACIRASAAPRICTAARGSAVSSPPPPCQVGGDVAGGRGGLGGGVEGGEKGAGEGGGRTFARFSS